MKCQFVKAYNDEVAQEEELDTVLGTKCFVIFRLDTADRCLWMIAIYNEIEKLSQHPSNSLLLVP